MIKLICSKNSFGGMDIGLSISINEVIGTYYLSVLPLYYEVCSSKLVHNSSFRARREQNFTRHKAAKFFYGSRGLHSNCNVFLKIFFQSKNKIK